MGGVLTHILIGLIGGLLIYHFSKKIEFFFAFFLGHTIVDVFKFGLSAIKQGTLAIFSVQKDSFYNSVSAISGDPANWLSLGFFVLSLVIFLYHHHVIRKKSFYEYEEVVWFFLAGVILHILADLVLVETSAWI